MRDYNFAFVGSRHRQLGGGGSKVGDITWAFANPDPTLYQDALVSQTLTVPPYGDLLAMQGPLFGKVKPYVQNATLTTALNIQSGCAWKGALYCDGTSAGGPLKRASCVAAFTAVPTLQPGAGSTGARPLASLPLGTFLLLVSAVGGSNIYFTVATSDTVKSATVFALVGSFPVVAFEGGGPNTIIVLVGAAGPIYRTLDKGATWAAVGGPLQVPGDRTWLMGATTGTGTMCLISAAGEVATDGGNDGGTWTVNSAVPGHVPLYQPSGLNCTSACLDKRPGARKGYALTAAGGLMSWNLNNPVAGFTRETADATFSTANQLRIASITAGIVVVSSAGIWFASYTNLANFTLGITAAVLQAPPTYMGTQTDLAVLLATVAAEPGNGELVFDNQGTTFNVKASFALNDGITKFDRYTINDPPLTSGRKPFIRVL